MFHSALGRGAVAALVAAVGISAVSPASAQVVRPTPAPDISPTMYQYMCSVFEDNMHAYLDKTGITAVYSSFADITYLRPALPCTVGNGSSLVLPVNIQGTGIGCAAQLGWGSLNSGNQQYWLFTANDNSCSMSVPSGWPSPVTGRSYHLNINQLGASQWQYVMRDNSTAQTYYAYGSRHGNGNEIWAGFEVHYRDDVMGGAGTAQYIYDMGWKTSSGASPIYLTSTTVHKGACSSTDCTWMSYWHSAALLDPDGHAKIYAYTSDH